MQNSAVASTGGYASLHFPLLSRIYSHLPIRDVVRASVVSKAALEHLAPYLADQPLERAFSQKESIRLVCDEHLTDKTKKQLIESISKVRLLRLHIASSSTAVQALSELLTLGWNSASNLKWLYVSGAVTEDGLAEMQKVFCVPICRLKSAIAKPLACLPKPVSSPDLPSVLPDPPDRTPSKRLSPTKPKPHQPRYIQLMLARAAGTSNPD